MFLYPKIQKINHKKEKENSLEKNIIFFVCVFEVRRHQAGMMLL
jgi:hypothetical protein